MGSFFQRKPVKTARVVFRWCRIVFLFCVFLVVAGITYLHLVGLPEFAKRSLLQTLRDHGFKAQFVSAHLGWGPVIIVENPSFQTTNIATSPRLSASMASLSLNFDDLLHRRIRVKSFQMSDARLRVPVAGTNAPFAINDLNIRMDLLPNDTLRLEYALFSFRGIQMRLEGAVTNYLDLRWWRPPFAISKGHPTPPSQAIPLPVRLGRIADLLDRIRLNDHPSLSILFSADGFDMNTLRASLDFTAAGGSTPWGRCGPFSLRVACAHPLDRTDAPMLQARISFQDATNQWASSKTIDLTIGLACNAQTNWDAAFNLGLTGLSAHAGANGVTADALWTDGNALLAFTNFTPKSADLIIRSRRVTTRFGTVGDLWLALRGTPAGHPPPPEAAWAFWNKLRRYTLDWQLAATNVNGPKLAVDTVQGAGSWRAPILTVSRLEARLYRGQLHGSALLNIATRETHLHGRSDFDPHRIAGLLTPTAQHWMSQYDWAQPPKVNGDVAMILPPWTNRPEDWRTNFRASVAVAGDFTAGAASFRGVMVTSAHSHFTYTNRVWNVPRLHAERPDGEMDMDYTGSDATHDYHFAFDCHLDPRDILPLLQPHQRRFLEECEFPLAPEIHGQAWGQWRQPRSVGFVGTLAATNASFRGVAFQRVRATASYTNEFLHLAEVEVEKDHGLLTIEKLTSDFAAKKTVLTNVVCTINPDVARKLLETNTPVFLKTIHFDLPPTIYASGSFVVGDPLATDFHFYVKGQQFHWTNITARKIEGSVLWQGRSVDITNIEANLYNTGTLVGWLEFHYIPKHGSSFNCDLNAKDIDLSALVKGLNGRASHIEGMLDGHITLGASETTNKSTWVGHGGLRVHDALLWDIRIFGVLSPILNAISPGAGFSRARAATATFRIKNNGVYSDDLRIESTGFELFYRGTIGMNKSINANVEADLLRNTPMLGPLLSTLLTPISKLFEYHISGTLQKPVIQPVFIPKFLMMILRPFHTLKELGAPSPGSAGVPPKTGKANH